MHAHRLFIIAPSLARLIRKERGGERVLEGYFPHQSRRRTFIQVEETRSSLILEADGEEAAEEQAGLPPAHAQALLAVSQGQVEYLRTRLVIGSHEIQALHVARPGPLDLVAIAVPSKDEHDFHPPPWFGPEVSTEPAYQRRRLAIVGGPEAPEVDVTDAALNSLLDLLGDQFTTGPQLHGVEILDARAAADAPVPETDDEIDDLGIEDAVIRDLARAL